MNGKGRKIFDNIENYFKINSRFLSNFLQKRGKYMKKILLLNLCVFTLTGCSINHTISDKTTDDFTYKKRGVEKAVCTQYKKEVDCKEVKVIKRMD